MAVIKDIDIDIGIDYRINEHVEILLSMKCEKFADHGTEAVVDFSCSRILFWRLKADQVVTVIERRRLWPK